MKIKVGYKTRDKIVRKVLLSSIELCYEEIVELLDLEGDLESYQKIDLADSIVHIKALKTVYKFYSIDNSKLDQYDLS